MAARTQVWGRKLDVVVDDLNPVDVEALAPRGIAVGLIRVALRTDPLEYLEEGGQPGDVGPCHA
jgi:hypothetical protein